MSESVGRAIFSDFARNGSFGPNTLILVLLLVAIVVCMCLIPLCIFYKCRRGHDDEDESGGRRNFAFDNQDGRPFSVAQGMEPPPTYEDAIKYDALRVLSLSKDDNALKNIINKSQRSNINKPFIIEMVPMSTILTTANQPDLPQNVPASTTGSGNNRSESGTGNSSDNPHSTTVSDATVPTTVVVDSTGALSTQPSQQQ